MQNEVLTENRLRGTSSFFQFGVLGLDIKRNFISSLEIISRSIQLSMIPSQHLYVKSDRTVSTKEEGEGYVI